FTTVAGIIEKSKTTEQEYALPFDLVGVMQKSTGSSYADKDGMHVAFLASNHTTGGNSGSPVLDHKGRLIGINFDRIWEGVMSDLYYYDRFSRNISVDVRYVLFVIEEVGNASWIVKEMRIEK
ncbi:MAG: S46 family peptidase, partial [Bacteroidota bacterium]